MDEKMMVALNGLSKAKLDKAFQKKYAKRSAEVSVMGLAEPPGDGPMDSFVALWRKFYPTIVSVLAFAAFLPWFTGPITVIRSLLGVVNDQIIPILDELD